MYRLKARKRRRKTDSIYEMSICCPLFFSAMNKMLSRAVPPDYVSTMLQFSVEERRLGRKEIAGRFFQLQGAKTIYFALQKIVAFSEYLPFSWAGIRFFIVVRCIFGISCPRLLFALSSAREQNILLGLLVMKTKA